MDNRYILPIIFVLFLAFKFYKLLSAKKKVPLLLKEGGIIVDVRTTSEFKSGANPLSVNIPHTELAARLHELDKNKPVILCCASGARSSLAARILKKNGFTNVFNAGAWRNTLLKSSARSNP
ncbi:MAG: hypothetical protein A2X86_08445 [Bdellovibrionales bacterium GWA2_49_15]|nr:MAG: hypothetical protein A2X86_08445 [Bdellovibrionales bacterium GWA2_49_15]HAZ11209.1 rhodanese-like domain-containing protein [Bdellovibrionales bacterium]